MPSPFKLFTLFATAAVALSRTGTVSAAALSSTTNQTETDFSPNQPYPIDNKNERDDTTDEKHANELATSSSKSRNANRYTVLAAEPHTAQAESENVTTKKKKKKKKNKSIDQTNWTAEDFNNAAFDKLTKGRLVTQPDKQFTIFSNCINECDQALKLKPNFIAALNTRAAAYGELATLATKIKKKIKYLNAALNDAKTVVQITVQNPTGQNNLAQIYYKLIAVETDHENKLAYYEQALIHSKNAIDLNKSNAMFLMNRVNVLIAHARFTNSVNLTFLESINKLCDKAIELDGNYEIALFSRATNNREISALISNQDEKTRILKQILIDSDKAINLNPNNGNNFFNRAFANLRLGQLASDIAQQLLYFEKALTDINNALKLQVNTATSFNLHATIHNELFLLKTDASEQERVNHLNESIASSNKAIAKQANYASAFNSLAFAYRNIAIAQDSNEEKIKYLIMAKNAVDDAIKYQDNDLESLSNAVDIYFDLAKSKSTNGPEMQFVTKTEQLCDKILRQNENHGPTLCTRAGVYVVQAQTEKNKDKKTKLFNQAINDCNKAIAQKFHNKMIHNNRAMAYQLLAEIENNNDKAETLTAKATSDIIEAKEISSDGVITSQTEKRIENFQQKRKFNPAAMAKKLHDLALEQQILGTADNNDLDFKKIKLKCSIELCTRALRLNNEYLAALVTRAAGYGELARLANNKDEKIAYLKLALADSNTVITLAPDTIDGINNLVVTCLELAKLADNDQLKSEYLARGLNYCDRQINDELYRINCALIHVEVAHQQQNLEQRKHHLTKAMELNNKALEINPSFAPSLQMREATQFKLTELEAKLPKSKPPEVKSPDSKKSEPTPPPPQTNWSIPTTIALTVTTLFGTTCCFFRSCLDKPRPKRDNKNEQAHANDIKREMPQTNEKQNAGASDPNVDNKHGDGSNKIPEPNKKRRKPKKKQKSKPQPPEDAKRDEIVVESAANIEKAAEPITTSTTSPIVQPPAGPPAQQPPPQPLPQSPPHDSKWSSRSMEANNPALHAAMVAAQQHNAANAGAGATASATASDTTPATTTSISTYRLNH